MLAPEIDRLAPDADVHASRELHRFLGGTDHDVAVDRQLLESLLHPVAGRLLRARLVCPSEPAGARERRALRHPRVALAEAGPGAPRLSRSLFADQLRH
jgi:hypothetical protein